jgi:hypothetical protein
MHRLEHHRPGPGSPLAPALLALALAAAIVGSAPAASRAQGPDREREQAPQQVVERILELQLEIDELLRALDPDLRAAVERELESRLARPAADADRVERVPDEPPAVETPEAPEAPGAPGAAPATGSSRPPEPAPAREPAAPDLPTAPPPPSACRPLALLDSDGDGRVSGADRYWRHLYLWHDADGDRAIDDGERLSLFELDVRWVAVELDSYGTDDDFVGDVVLGEEAVFRLVGRRKESDRRALALDADGLRRGDGPALVDDAGAPLSGVQPLRRGSAMLDADGSRFGFPCPLR